MRLPSRSGMIATAMVVSAIAAPGAQAGGLLSGPRPDPKGADQQEAQSFARIYGAPHSSVVRVANPTSDATESGFDYGDAAIGAGIAGGAALMIAGGTMGVRRRSHLRHP